MLLIKLLLLPPLFLPFFSVSYAYHNFQAGILTDKVGTMHIPYAFAPLYISIDLPCVPSTVIEDLKVSAGSFVRLTDKELKVVNDTIVLARAVTGENYTSAYAAVLLLIEQWSETIPKSIATRFQMFNSILDELHELSNIRQLITTGGDEDMCPHKHEELWGMEPKHAHHPVRKTRQTNYFIQNNTVTHMYFGSNPADNVISTKQYPADSPISYSNVAQVKKPLDSVNHISRISKPKNIMPTQPPANNAQHLVDQLQHLLQDAPATTPTPINMEDVHQYARSVCSIRISGKVEECVQILVDIIALHTNLILDSYVRNNQTPNLTRTKRGLGLRFIGRVNKWFTDSPDGDDLDKITAALAGLRDLAELNQIQQRDLANSTVLFMRATTEHLEKVDNVLFHDIPLIESSLNTLQDSQLTLWSNMQIQEKLGLIKTYMAQLTYTMNEWTLNLINTRETLREYKYQLNLIKSMLDTGVINALVITRDMLEAHILRVKMELDPEFTIAEHFDTTSLYNDPHSKVFYVNGSLIIAVHIPISHVNADVEVIRVITYPVPVKSAWFKSVLTPGLWVVNKHEQRILTHIFPDDTSLTTIYHAMFSGQYGIWKKYTKIDCVYHVVGFEDNSSLHCPLKVLSSNYGEPIQVYPLNVTTWVIVSLQPKHSLIESCYSMGIHSENIINLTQYSILFGHEDCIYRVGTYEMRPLIRQVRKVEIHMESVIKTISQNARELTTEFSTIAHLIPDNITVQLREPEKYPIHLEHLADPKPLLLHEITEGYTKKMVVYSDKVDALLHHLNETLEVPDAPIYGWWLRQWVLVITIGLSSIGLLLSLLANYLILRKMNLTPMQIAATSLPLMNPKSYGADAKHLFGTVEKIEPAALDNTTYLTDSSQVYVTQLKEHVYSAGTHFNISSLLLLLVIIGILFAIFKWKILRAIRRVVGNLGYLPENDIVHHYMGETRLIGYFVVSIKYRPWYLFGHMIERCVTVGIQLCTIPPHPSSIIAMTGGPVTDFVAATRKITKFGVITAFEFDLRWACLNLQLMPTATILSDRDLPSQVRCAVTHLDSQVYDIPWWRVTSINCMNINKLICLDLTSSKIIYDFFSYQ